MIDDARARLVDLTVVLGGSLIVAAEADAQRLPMHDRIDSDEFAIVLVGKFGGEKFRTSTPADMRALFSLIDSMPMREQEMRDRGVVCR